MREIKFKAKRLDNGKWVKGWYREQIEDVSAFGEFEPKYELCYFIRYDAKKAGEIGTDNERPYYIDVEIDPKTICEYTGRKDINGVEIWENDIIKNEYERGKFQRYYILFDKKSLKFITVNKYGMTGDYVNIMGTLEVIGNKFDNPELLEEL